MATISQKIFICRLPALYMLHLRTFKGGYDSNFSYILYDHSTKEAAIIDTSIEPDTLLSFIQEKRLQLKFVVIMHSHFDHMVGIDRYREKGIKLAASEKMQKEIDIKLKDGDELQLGDHQLKVLFTPGHIYDSICILVQGKLFTSDTLFIDGCGRVDLQGADVEDMFNSLQKIKQLPDDTIIYPGHDYGRVPFETLGNQKKSNRFLQAEPMEEFVGERGG